MSMTRTRLMRLPAYILRAYIPIQVGSGEADTPCVFPREFFMFLFPLAGRAVHRAPSFIMGA